jgi:hypothetical protein
MLDVVVHSEALLAILMPWALPQEHMSNKGIMTTLAALLRRLKHPEGVRLGERFRYVMMSNALPGLMAND